MINKKGFTLVELLAVIAILAILVLIALPNVLGMFNNARKNSFVNEAKILLKQSETEFIKDNFNNAGSSTYDSENNKLSLDGRELYYIINLDRKGKVLNYIISDERFCISSDKSYVDISADDVDSNACEITSNQKTNIYVISLHEENIIDPTPNKLYMQYGKGWYTDSEKSNIFTKLETLPVREGYTFDGYTLKNNDIIDKDGNLLNVGTEFISDINHEFVAVSKWIGNEYQVSFDVNGGNAIPATTLNVTFGNAYGLLPEPNKTGYTFDGWYTEKTDGTKITEASIVSIAENHTLYAHYTSITFDVLFNANGGSVETASKSVIFNETYGTLPTPTRAGYTFDGWYTTETSGIKVEETTKVSVAENHTLYAHWAGLSSTITLNYSVLPDGYTELQNIKFARGSMQAGYYIDLGFVGSNNIGFEIDVDVNTAGTEYGIFGARTTWDVRRYELTTHDDGAFIMYGNGTNSGYNCQYYSNPNSSVKLNLFSGTNLKMTFNKNNDKKYSTNTVGSGTFSDFSYTTPSNIILGAQRMSGSEYSCGVVTRSAGIYEFGTFTLNRLRFYNNGSILNDFIPAKNLSGTVGIYDVKGGVFRTSTHQGSGGSLTAGTASTVTATATATYGSDMPSISVPVKKGYTFGGYYTGRSCSGTQYYNASGASVKKYDKTANTTLYACWTLNTNSVY